MLTKQYVNEIGKPLFEIEIDEIPKYITLSSWLDTNNILTLNVAGPRASECKGIHAAVYDLLGELFKHYQP